MSANSTPSEMWAARIAEAQTKTRIHFCGIPYARIRYGADYPDGQSKCRDCGVSHGQFHVPTCCVERCPVCGGQAMCCGCADGDTDDEEVEA